MNFKRSKKSASRYEALVVCPHSRACQGVGRSLVRAMDGMDRAFDAVSAAFDRMFR